MNERSPRTRQARGSCRNFSRKRPEVTNLNHQYANRRVFMSPIPNSEVARARRD
jgi:hypothetical protein